MEVSYRRSFNESYMIIEGEQIAVGYEEEMLRQNQLQSLLHFYTTEANGKIQFWYEITGKESLQDYLEQNSLNMEILSHIVTCLAVAYEEISRYLLLQQHIYLHTESIYIERSQKKMQIQLCYCPMQAKSFGEQFRMIMEYILTIIDHNQELLTSVCYDIYELTMTQECSIQEVSKRLLVEQTPHVEQIDLRTGSIEFAEGKQLEKEDLQEETKEGFAEVILKRLEEGKIYLKEHLIEKFLHKVIQERNKTYEEDIVYEPAEKEIEPTTLLHEGPVQCSGRLQYTGDKEEKDYLIEGESFSIGSRNESNDANLNSQAVSRRHAKITCQNHVFYLTDLNSTNGTYVNGQLLNYKEKIKLSPMDCIQFADVPYIIM